MTPGRRLFVEASVTDGQFASADDVIAHALDVLREQEMRRAEFAAMLEAVDEAAAREGCIATAERCADTLAWRSIDPIVSLREYCARCAWQATAERRSRTSAAVGRGDSPPAA